MNRSLKYKPNFYTLDLLTGKTCLLPSRIFMCFFITEQEYCEVFIREQLLSLLTSQCLYIGIYGSQSSQWGAAYDAICAQLYPRLCCPCSVYSTIFLFKNDLHELLTTRPLVPCDIYLVYDDNTVFRQVLDLLNL